MHESNTVASFGQVRNLTLDLLTQNVDWLLKIRAKAEPWNETRHSHDFDVAKSVEVVSELLQALRAKEATDLVAFSYDLGKMASMIALAKSTYSRENADYWYALSFTHAAFMVMLEMLELTENPLEKTK